MDRKKTKIVATISDLRCDVDFIRDLHKAGMDVARLNTAHQSEDASLQIIENIRKVSDKIAILIDTKGPEIRTFNVKEPIPVKTGDTIYIQRADMPIVHEKTFSTSYNNFASEIPVGATVLIDDGELEVVVEKKEGETLLCSVRNDGTVKNKKSINVPNVGFKLPSLTDKDHSYVNFAIKHDIDFIAHSFVRNRIDLKAIQDILDSNHSKIKIISKIENQEGVDNIDEILEHSYGIMVARGDLAIEIPYEQIPGIQKMLVEKAIAKRKPVIIATQMLHSMISNPRPTRAEVSDIANAIYSKADAIMLSGETTFGKYPVEAVTTMRKVALEVEQTCGDFHDIPMVTLSTETSAYLTRLAVKSSVKLSCRAIIADTTTGRTIRNMAGYRGMKKIFAICYDKRTVRELQMSYGVIPYHLEMAQDHQFIKASLSCLSAKGYFAADDKVVILGGNFGVNNGATFIEISSVQNLMNQ